MSFDSSGPDDERGISSSLSGKIFGAVSLAWILYIGWTYFRVFLLPGLKGYQSAITDWELILPCLVALASYKGICYALERWACISRAKIVAITLAGLWLLLLLAAADKTLFVKFIAVGAAFLFAAVCTGALVERWIKVTLPFWASILLMVVIVQYIFFAMAVAGWFTKYVVAMVMIPFIIWGALEAARARHRLSAWWQVWEREFTPASAWLLEGLWIVLALAFVCAYPPETVSDAARSHVPFMAALARQGVLLPNFYWYAHLAPTPIQVTAAGGYLFLDEIGATWISYFLGITLICIIVGETRRISGVLTAGLAAGFLFAASPFLWFWLTTNYYDLALSAFCVGGLALWLRGITVSPQVIVIAAIFFGFATITKYTAALYPLAAIIVTIIARPVAFAGFARSQFGLLLISAGFFGATTIPWVLHTWIWTGNPFFPMFNESFHSPYITKLLMDSLQLQYPMLFKFPWGWWDALTWPWTVTFKTSSYVETSDGFIGPFILAFLPPAVVAIGWFTVARRRWPPGGIFFLLTGFLFCVLLITMLKAPYLRYLFPGMATMWIGVAVLAAQIVALANLSRAVASGFSAALATAGVVLLVGYGVYVTYGGPTGAAWQLYRGQISKEVYLGKPKAAVARYINERASRADRILAVNFDLLNTLNTMTYQIMPWYDPVMGLENADDFARFIKAQNVRYWIVQDTPWPSWVENHLQIYKNLGVAQRFWIEEHLVARYPPYSIYNVTSIATVKPVIGVIRNDE